MVVQHNLTAMNSNRMLGITTSAQAKSTEKLSSGYKINRAADDAARLSISEKMRKQIRGLTQASLNAEDGISSVQTAEGALNEVQDMLQRMNELAVKASNGTLSESDRQDVQNEIDQLVTEIDRVSETTKFNETYLLKGDNTVDKKVTYDYTKKVYTADQTLYDANGTEVAEGTVLDNNGTYYTGRTAAGQEALDPTDAQDVTLLTATKVSFSTAVYSRDENGNSTYIAAGDLVDVGTTIYGNAIAAAKGDATQAYTISADDVTTGIMGGTAATIDGGKLLDAAGTAVTANATVEEASSKINLYTVDANGKETVIEAGESFDIGNAATTFKALSYTGTGAVSYAEFDKYAVDSQLMDKDGNEVAANGLYSYFDEDGNYKGGLYKYADEENPSIKNLTEMSAGEVALFVEQGEKETGALTLTLHVGADATKNNQISVDIDAMSVSSLGVENLKVTGKDDTNALNVDGAIFYVC